MTQAITRIPAQRNELSAKSALLWSAKLWFVVAVVGQWIFVAYIALSYSGLALQGSTESLKSFGIHSGDAIGNVAMALHVLFAVVIIGGGSLQLLPSLRAIAPRFHHWNGRVYITASVVTAIGGLYLIWTRDIPGGLVLRLGISLDAVLIIVFAFLALRFAIAKQIKTHRRWALRLFMVVSAVWFYRIGLMFWIVVNQGPVGFDFETLEGPFIYFLNFAQYLLPLAVLELYFRASDGTSRPSQWAVASLIGVATLATAFGIFAATVGMWLPRITAENSFWMT
jgi:hypothetical protein